MNYLEALFILHWSLSKPHKILLMYDGAIGHLGKVRSNFDMKFDVWDNYQYLL